MMRARVVSGKIRVRRGGIVALLDHGVGCLYFSQSVRGLSF